MTTTTRRVDHGPFIAQALRESREVFARDADPQVVGRWVQRRVAELAGDATAKAGQPQLFDDEIAEAVRTEHRPE